MELIRVITLIIATISFISMIIPEILAGGNTSTASVPGRNDICPTKLKCSHKGPSVRFPFRIQGKQPPNCAYNQSYNLYCDESGRTVFDIPSSSSNSSIKFMVISIDYSTQMMQVKPAENCMPKQVRGFEISKNTPFKIISRFYGLNVNGFSLFNCSANSEASPWKYDTFRDYWNVSCLESPGFGVVAIDVDTDILGLPMQFCTKMFNTELLLGGIYNGFEGETIVSLNWSLPVCKSCEMQGGICTRQINGTDKILCFSHSVKKVKISHIISPVIGFLLLTIVTTLIYIAYSKKKQDEENQKMMKKFLKDYEAMNPTRYSYADIKRMTNDFREQLGEGSFGNVFKGKVSNHIFVAVKMLHNSDGNGEEFINEVETMGKVHHINVVRLLGFCADGVKRALVYEFLANGSLDKFVFPKGHEEHHHLGMQRLRDIAIGIARGIEYLHQGCEQRILHFDIKPHNILLDENYVPKISDFGLAKLCEKGRSAVSMTAVRGTMGYIAPEVFSRHFGNVTNKSDIYSFGMLLLEMVGRRKNIDTNVRNVSQVYFPEWVYGRLVKGEELRIQVEEIDGEEDIARRLAIAGLWCIQWDPVDRPSITFVLQILEGNCENLILPANPFASSGTAEETAIPNSERTRLSSLAETSESE